MSITKYQGCLLGALIGDCMGAPFEMSYFGRNGIKREIILNKLSKTLEKKESTFGYTDDSAMTKSVAHSLLKNNGFSRTDMARRFRDDYIKEPFRGYGGGVVSIFQQWNTKEITDDNVYLPSKHQFDGSGSFGNGAAMRVAPIPLFAKSPDQCIEIAQRAAQLTHYNKHGINGAILQALAIFHALQSKKDNFKVDEFLTYLKKQMKTIEKASKVKIGHHKNENENIEEYAKSENFSYCSQLEVIEKLISNENTDLKTVIEQIGHDISAMTAVPAAIISFLKNIDNGFEEVLYYAISLGGDTDTIASMACAIAGAFYGAQDIPKLWIEKCEDSDILVDMGEKLYQVHS
ncbi:ADP-ribosylhydrolase ARH3-like [Clytia hemisphaerica]|uniref:ADP-ribosylhydrolase ARH3 n=2 Tax=Clytia hemisphaerica TaxID=252671 RepID=A0A7M5UKJ7_9CNID